MSRPNEALVPFVPIISSASGIVVDNSEYDAPLVRLCYALSVLNGSPAAFVCYYNSVLLRDAMMDEIARRISVPVSSYLVQTPDVLAHLVVNTNVSGVIMLVIKPGLERDALRCMNIRREYMWLIPASLVVWLPIEINARTVSPDFNAFCRGRFYFYLSATWLEGLIEKVLQASREGKISTQETNSILAIAFEESISLDVERLNRLIFSQKDGE